MNWWAKIKSLIEKKWPETKGWVAGYFFYICIGLVVLVASIILYYDKKSELLATLWISSIAAVLSFNSYIYTKEKFRLDLLDRRFEIYEKTLEFCSLVTQHATLVARDDNHEQIAHAIMAAQASFRGLGYHKTQALFGDDIHQHFEKLNKTFAWLSTHFDFETDPDWPQKKADHVMFAWNTVDQLPKIFKPYIYFGDYRRNIVRTS